MVMSKLKKYYGAKGGYLKEHQKYFSQKQLKQDVGFLVAALHLKLRDKILDLACGHGRHAIELNRRGFDVDGLDSSKYLLDLAKTQAKQAGVVFHCFKQDINQINLKTKYDKIFLFFSEFGLFNPDKVLRGVVKSLKLGGLFLLDCDNVFRLLRYLEKHPRSSYVFDFVTMELGKKGGSSSRGSRYYTLPQLKELFQKHRLRVVSVYGGYDRKSLNSNSKRLVVVGKKV